MIVKPELDAINIWFPLRKSAYFAVKILLLFIFADTEIPLSVLFRAGFGNLWLT